MCSLALDNLQCPCELCVMNTSHGLTTETCAVCMIPTHATCLDQVTTAFEQSSAPFGDVRPEDVTTTLTNLGIYAEDILSHVQVGVGHAWCLIPSVHAHVLQPRALWKRLCRIIKLQMKVQNQYTPTNGPLVHRRARVRSSAQSSSPACRGA